MEDNLGREEKKNRRKKYANMQPKGM